MSEAELIRIARSGMFVARKDTPSWNTCRHNWVERGGDYDCAPGSSQVICYLCGCPGQQVGDGEVYWPTT